MKEPESRHGPNWPTIADIHRIRATLAEVCPEALDMMDALNAGRRMVQRELARHVAESRTGKVQSGHWQTVRAGDAAFMALLDADGRVLQKASLADR